MDDKVEFLATNKEAFDSSSPKSNAFYFIDGEELYLGSMKLSNEKEIASIFNMIQEMENQEIESITNQEMEQLLTL